ncbi:hypothetical protein L1049_005853 [Liquidambar formosana]|uniref:Uncharacterized protein n=1 Tax=Liquidambar formosana TaxID=63359 RepID=A0AAP0WQ74_LIQFO
MAGTTSEEFGVGRSKEGISSGQYCQSGEALAEWWSSYWGTDDDNDLGIRSAGREQPNN